MTELAKLGNAGPGNVAIQLVRHWPQDDEMATIEKSGYARLQEVMKKELWSECVLVDDDGKLQRGAQWLC